MEKSQTCSPAPTTLQIFKQRKLKKVKIPREGITKELMIVDDYFDFLKINCLCSSVYAKYILLLLSEQGNTPPFSLSHTGMPRPHDSLMSHS